MKILLVSILIKIFQYFRTPLCFFFPPNSLAQYSFTTFHMTIIIHDNNLIFIIANLGSFLSLSHLLVRNVLYNFRVDNLREQLLGFS